MQIAKGIELLRDIPGEGPEAEKGAVVTYNARFFLRKGDEVTRDAQSIALYGSRLHTRTIDGVELIDTPQRSVSVNLLPVSRNHFMECSRAVIVKSS